MTAHHPRPVATMAPITQDKPYRCAVCGRPIDRRPAGPWRHSPVSKFTEPSTPTFAEEAVVAELTRREFYDVLVALKIADAMNPLEDRYERLRARLSAEDLRARLS